MKTNKKENKNMKTKTFKERRFEELEKFCEENNRMPDGSGGHGKREAVLYDYFRHHKNEPEFKELYEKYKRKQKHSIEELREFCEKNNRLPNPYIKGEPGLYTFYSDHRNEPEFKELYEKYRKIIRYSIEELREFCEKNNRLPNQSKDERGLYDYFYRRKNKPEFKELYEKYGGKERNSIKSLREFCEKNNRFPCSSIKNEVVLYMFYSRHRNEPEFKELYEKYNRTIRYSIEELREFCEKNNRLPNQYGEERGLYDYLRRHKNEPNFVELIKQYGKIKQDSYTIDDLRLYCKKHSRFPQRDTELYKLYQDHKNEPNFVEIYKEYELLDRLVGWVECGHRLPSDDSRYSRDLYQYMIDNIDINPVVKTIYVRYSSGNIRTCPEDLENFCKAFGRLPRQAMFNYLEHRLCNWMKSRCKKGDQEVKKIVDKYSTVSKRIQDFFDKYGRLPKEYSPIEEERILGEKLEKDPDRALKGVNISIAPIVLRDFEQFTVAQQYEVMSIFGIPSSFMDEACKGRTKRATTETLQEVFKKRGAVLEATKDGENTSNKSITEIGRIKRFSVVMEKYNADPHSPYLINESLNNLWDTIIIESKHNSKKTYNELMSDSETTEFFNIIRSKVAEEYKKAVEYRPSNEYSNKWDPDLMQRLCIIRLRERKYYANWSKTGTGKTLQSLLSSLDIDAKITIYVLPNSTIADKAGTGIDGNVGAIREFIPKSNVIIYKGKSSLARIDETKRNYILVNYEKLSRHKFLKGLENLAESGKIDFICIDEVQMAKSRGDKIASNRSKALLAFRRLAQDHNPNLYVLGLTATPVINNLYEVKTLCEIITGKQLGDDKLFTGNSISFASAQTAHKYLVNYGFRYNHDYSSEITENEQIIPIKGGPEIYNEINKINDKFRNLGKSRRGVAGIKELEESLIIPKLENCKHLIKPGVVLYIQYVGHTIEIINKWLQKNGIGYVLYTGIGAELTEDEETGEMIKVRDEELKKFIGDPKRGIQGSHIAKILIASSVLRTGVDGLQKVSNTIIMLNLPWTYADYEQLKGRLIRKNSAFDKVNIYIPMISLKLKSGEWSWDRAKWEILQYKKDLSDLIIYGDYVNSNILKIAQNETESSLIEKVLGQLDSPLEFYSEEIHPDVNYEEIRKKLGSPKPYKKPKYSCIVYLHQRINKFTTQEIEEDNNEPGRWRQMYDYWVDQDSIVHKKGYVDPNVETADLINDIYGGPDKKVADLGCGIHDPLRKLVTNCGEFFSCTFEPKEIELPEGVVRCDSTRLTMVEDKYFNIANHTNSHWGTNLDDYVREDYRILKDDGILIITSVCPSRRNKYKIIAKAYLDSGLWEYEREPVRFGGKSGMMRGIFRKKRV